MLDNHGTKRQWTIDCMNSVFTLLPELLSFVVASMRHCHLPLLAAVAVTLEVEWISGGEDGMPVCAHRKEI